MIGTLTQGAQVSTIIGLLGLIAVLAAAVFLRNSRNSVEVIKQLPPEKRAKATDEYLSRYGLDAKGLSQDQTFELIKSEQRYRMAWKFFGLIIVCIFSFGCLALAGISKYYSDRISQAEEHISPNTEILKSAYNIGMVALDYGRYTKEEDERFDSLIKNANNIDIIIYNGDGLFSSDRFSNLFKSFFQKDSALMRVLFATPMSLFSKQNLDMTLKMYNPPVDYAADAASVDRNLTRLRGWTDDIHKLQYKYYDTELRFPIIIIDNRYCIITVRLPPDEGQQSIRLEVQNEPGQSGLFFQSCLNHFARMWALSHDTSDIKQ